MAHLPFTVLTITNGIPIFAITKNSFNKLIYRAFQHHQPLVFVFTFKRALFINCTKNPVVFFAGPDGAASGKRGKWEREGGNLGVLPSAEGRQTWVGEGCSDFGQKRGSYLAVLGLTVARRGTL